VNSLEASQDLVAADVSRSNFLPRDQSRLTSAATEEETCRRLLAFLRLMGLFDRPATADCLGHSGRSPRSPPYRAARRAGRSASKQCAQTPRNRETAHGEPRRGRRARLARCASAHPDISRNNCEKVGRAVLCQPLGRTTNGVHGVTRLPRRLARGAPAALRTPLREHAGQTPAHARRPPAALPSRGPRLLGGIAAGGACPSLLLPTPERRRTLCYIQTRSDQFRPGSVVCFFETRGTPLRARLGMTGKAG